ncbi:MAG: RNA polymerase sporulation sigma factor SigH [Armatimonadota bacterium]
MHSRFEGNTDQEIVAAAQNGDESAAEYLLYKYKSLVRTKVRSYFLMGGEKDDLLQVGMIGLWQAIVDFRADKDISFLSFARICIERHVITAIKTATRRKQTPLNSSIPLEHSSDDNDSEWNLEEVLVSDDTIDPENLVLQREDKNRLQYMLKRLLSDFEWEVLTGYQVGKSYREIACELQCKTKSVDNALARIKRKISCSPYGWPGITDNNN